MGTCSYSVHIITDCFAAGALSTESVKHVAVSSFVTSIVYSFIPKLML